MKTITGIHGVPRSGTSWLSQIFNASPEVSLKFQPLFSYAFKSKLNETSSIIEVANFFKDIYKSDDDFINMRDTNLLKGYPKFNKSEQQPHLVFKHVRYHHLLSNLMIKNTKLKLILVVRNPMAVLSSWKNSPREFHESWSFSEEWEFAKKKNFDNADYFGFDRWKQATKIFLELEGAYPNRVKLITYKSLLNNTLEEVENLYDFTGLKINKQCLNFIINSKTKQDDHPNSVYKIKNDDEAYKYDLPIKIQNTIIDNLKGTCLERFLNE